MGKSDPTRRCGEDVACCGFPGERPSEKLRAFGGLSRLAQPESVCSSVK